MAKNCCKYFTVSLVPAASLTLAVVFGLGIVVLPILYVHLADDMRYGIVIDAGSSHTDMYVYKWPIPKDEGTASVTQISRCKDDRSLNSYNRTPDKAGDLFNHCFNEVQSEVDIPHSDTELFLGATAGMRLVERDNNTISEAIMQSANDSLQNTAYTFKSGRIISGKEEATGGWITANYASKRLKKSNAPLMGSLDLGGASTEIAFQYQPHGTPQPEYEVTVELFGERHNLYARSYLCYGQNEARWRLLAHLINITSNRSGHIPNPCMLKGANMTFSEEDIYSSLCVKQDTSSDVFGFGFPPPSRLLSEKASGNATNYTFQGTGEPHLCNATIMDVFSVTNCSDRSICVNTSYLWPPVNNSGTFVGMSGFYHAAWFFNTSDRELRDLHNFSTNVLEFCSVNYSTALHHYPSDRYLQDRCFDGLFSLFLLETAFGFNSTSNWTLNFSEKVHDLTVSWAMGYLLNQTNSIPNSPHQVQRPFSAVDLVVGIIVLSILCFVFIVFFFLTFHACRKVLKTRGGYSHIS